MQIPTFSAQRYKKIGLPPPLCFAYFCKKSYAQTDNLPYLCR